MSDIQIKDKDLEHCPEKVLNALCDDLNTSKALAEFNEISKKLSSAESMDDKIKYKTEFLASSKVFGILQKSPKKWLGIGQIQDNLDSEFIENLINEREEARLSKDFSKADQNLSMLLNYKDNINDKHTIFRKTSKIYDRNILAGSIPILYDK